MADLRYNPASLLLGITLLLAACGDRPATTAQQVDVMPTELSVDSIALQIMELDGSIAKSPSNALLYARRGMLYAALDSGGRALSDLNRAIMLDSTNAYYRKLIGDQYYKSLQVDKALDQFDKAVRLDANDPFALLKRAEIQLVKRKYPEAIRDINDALRKDANVAHGYYLKGFIHMESGDTALAISSLRTAVEQDPTDHSAYVLLGKLSAAQRDPLAVHYYNSALDIRPNSLEALYNLGVYYQDLGQDSAAIQCYDRILEKAPDNILALYNKAWIALEHKENYPAAIKGFEDVLDRMPEHGDAWYNIGVAYERQGHLEQAADKYRSALLMERNHPLALEGLDRLSRKGVRIPRLPSDR